MTLKPVICDEYWLSCTLRSKEEYTEKVYGRKGHEYYRHICTSGGIYEDKICKHAICGDCYLAPHHKKRTPLPTVRTYKVPKEYPDLVKQ
jgi:hypothetical protein